MSEHSIDPPALSTLAPLRALQARTPVPGQCANLHRAQAPQRQPSHGPRQTDCDEIQQLDLTGTPLALGSYWGLLQFSS
jgi:hypothetical protein